MSYKDTLDRISAQKRARIRERQFKEIKRVVLQPVRENANVIIGATTLATVGIIGVSAMPVYADSANEEIMVEDTTKVYIKDAPCPAKSVVDTEKTDMNRHVTAGVTSEIYKVAKEQDYTYNNGHKIVQEILIDTLSKKSIEEEEPNKKELTEEEKAQLLWEKEKEYCLLQQQNVYDNWRTTRGKGVSNSSTRTHMSYTAVTSTSSMQYKILRSKRAWNSKYTGLRMYDDRYCVAVGTKYGRAGDKIDLVMEDGSVVKAIIGDIKSNKDTDETHMFQKDDGSIVELITDGSEYDRNKVPAVLRQHIKAIVNIEGIDFE